MDRGTMSGHEPVRDDPGDPLVLRAATIGHRMAMGPGEPALSEWAAAGLDLPDETAMMRYRLDRTVKQLEDRDLDMKDRLAIDRRMKQRVLFVRHLESRR